MPYRRPVLRRTAVAACALTHHESGPVTAWSRSGRRSILAAGRTTLSRPCPPMRVCGVERRATRNGCCCGLPAIQTTGQLFRRRRAPDSRRGLGCDRLRQKTIALTRSRVSGRRAGSIYLRSSPCYSSPRTRRWGCPARPRRAVRNARGKPYRFGLLTNWNVCPSSTGGLV